MRLDLVAADEQGWVALDQVEQQPLISDPAAVFAEGIGEADIERDLAQAHALAVEPGRLRHQPQADRLFRLQADDQLVRPGRRAARGEDRIRHVLELDEDLGVALGHALAGAQVEGNALPSPIVDVRLHRDEGLGRAVVADLLSIARHRLAIDRAARILASHALRLDIGGRDRPQRAQDLHFLVAHRGRVEIGRRLHRHQREQLEHVVLHHVAKRAGAVVIIAAALDPDRLGDGDLDVVDMRAVPQRLEHRVREPQREQVLDRLLAEIMVDPERALLGKGGSNGIVDLAAGFEVAAERLFERHPHRRASEARPLRGRRSSA